MKKFLLPIIAGLLLFASCSEKPTIMTSYYTVEKGDWDRMIRTTSDSTYIVDYYYSAWENRDITLEALDYGFVLAYYIDEDGRDNILPYTRYYLDDNGVPYQERIEYDLSEGVITFKIKDSDFQTDQSYANLGTMHFKVSVMANM